MEAVFAITLGVMMASGVYLLLRARLFPVVMGLTLISYAVNLFIFAMGRLASGIRPLSGKAPSTVIRCRRRWC